MRVYLDTSALAKRYVQEPGSEELEDLFSRGVTEAVVSTLTLPEFGAALERRMWDDLKYFNNSSRDPLNL